MIIVMENGWNSIGRILLILLIFISAGCAREREVKIPENVMNQEKMVEVLTDMHLIEGARMGRRIMGDTLNLDSYYTKVFEKHQINKETLDSSYVFYSHHPRIMDKIYDKVIENLNEVEVASPIWEEEKEEEEGEEGDQ